MNLSLIMTLEIVKFLKTLKSNPYTYILRLFRLIVFLSTYNIVLKIQGANVQQNS
jgi:hypothetical protein